MLLLLLALTPQTETQVVEAARRLIGTPYELGGRQRGAAIDCQGLLFFALEEVFGCSWRSYSVYPTRSLATGELGRRVPGLDPVASAELDLTKLRAGDVLMLVDPAENPAEPAIGRLGGEPVWVWHVGVYAGGGRWIVGDHFAGEVVEVDLARYLAEHRDTYAGVFVTRIRRRPRPRRCR